jgi:hypothetical protein
MTFGFAVNGVNLSYGHFSVVSKGTVTGNMTFNKSDYPQVTQYKVVFIPTGVRDTSKLEVRPSFSDTTNTITITLPSNAGPHEYMLLGR